jgi:hypothetical protein
MKNPFIYTCAPNVGKNSEIYQKSIFHHTKTCLISLIHAGLSSSDFNINTLLSGLKTIQQFRKTYLTNNETLFLDSGGYSIISGKVLQSRTSIFISCYIDACKILKDEVDYIFQLDIPVFLNEPKYNNRTTIYELNKKSLEETKNLIEEFPEIKDKFLAILQFKMKSQFDIWDSLYNELEIYNYHKYYAVGGLVSLYGICPHINFAPFIGPVYYWLYYYQLHSQFKYPFFIHILGTYHKFTRFIIILMNKLISKTLQEFNQTSYITYDSVNYTLSALYKAKVGMEYYDFNNNELTVDAFNVKWSHSLSDEKLKSIYVTDECLNSYLENMKRIKKNDKLTDVTFLVPLNISSQLNLDAYFDYFIDHHKLVDIIHDFKKPPTIANIDQLNRRLTYFLTGLTYHDTLTINLVKQITNSIGMLYSFHYNFVNNMGDKEKMMKMMNSFISNHIKFPLDLG